MTRTAINPGVDLFIALFRLWSQARLRCANPLPDMYAHGARCGATAELVPACESCFVLTEACLGRPLGRGGDEALSRDEQALLLMLLHAPSVGPVRGSESVPHGLPGALCWASFAVTRALGEAVAVDMPPRLSDTQCPFGPLTAWAA